MRQSNRYSPGRLLLSVLVLGMLATGFSSPALAEESDVVTFSGVTSKTNLAFSVHNDWELHWQAEGDPNFPSISQFEVRLYDAASGQYLGLVAQNTGSGEGIRHFDKGGRFYLNVLARDVRWTIRVIDDAEAWRRTPGFENAEEKGVLEVEILDDVRIEERLVPEKKPARINP